MGDFSGIFQGTLQHEELKTEQDAGNRHDIHQRAHEDVKKMQAELSHNRMP